MWVLRFQYMDRAVVVPMRAPRLRVGRAEENDVILPLAGISRRHCEFYRSRDEEERLFVRDLGSMLGIKRDDGAITEAELRDGDCLSLGPVWVFVLREGSFRWHASDGATVPRAVLDIGQGSPSGKTAQPAPEHLPLELFVPCLELLGRAPDWGAQWMKLLGVSRLEIVCSTVEDTLCLWPGECGARSNPTESVTEEGEAGAWTATWAGGRHGAKPVLKALLRVMDRMAAERGSTAVVIPAQKDGNQSPLGLESAWMEIERLIGTDLPLLIGGETGTGKEVLARAIHEASLGAQAPFVAVHCAAIPEALIESELFGIEPNTATGVAGREGLLASAHGGTIFLDEVGEIPPTFQTKLLRVLESSEVTTVGGRKQRPLKVRWLSSTNRDLEEAMKVGGFRRDLYYRLRGAKVVIPPLRERLSCLPALVARFLSELESETPKGIQGLSLGAYRVLVAQEWPGNVRELKMEVRRAYHMASAGGMISPRHLSSHLLDWAGDATTTPQILDHRRAVVERHAVEEALRHFSGNISKAAALLGVSRPTLYKRMKELDLGSERGKAAPKDEREGP